MAFEIETDEKYIYTNSEIRVTSQWELYDDTGDEGDGLTLHDEPNFLCILYENIDIAKFIKDIDEEYYRELKKDAHKRAKEIVLENYSDQVIYF